MSYSTSKIIKITIGTAGILVVLIFWTLLSRNYHPLILPSPVETFRAVVALWKSGDLLENTLITMRRTIIGYSMAVFMGTLLAILLKSNKFCQHLLRPLITIIQTTPPVVWLVLAVIWFGIADNLTPIFLIFIVTFPVIFVNIFSGLDNINLKLVEMARVYRCSKEKILLNIYLPGLIPHIVSAMSIGLAFAWKSSIFAEFIGSSSGIGFELSMANSNLQTDLLFGWAIILIILMLIFEYGILQPAKAYVTRWDSNE
ncbi:MAG: ABC transporter permease [Halanaerobiales bacterium]